MRLIMNQKIKPMTLLQLSQAYGVKTDTAKKWFRKVLDPAVYKKRKSIYTPKEIETIISHIGPF